MLAEMFIDELKTMAIIGCNPDERIAKQPIIISLAYQCNIANAVDSDDINQTVDYDRLSKLIVKFIQQSRFELIETLAERLVDYIFSVSSINSLSLFLYKPDALSDAKRVGIKIQRKRESVSKVTQSHELSWE